MPDETGPLTRDAAKAEMGRAMRDPTHPQHHNYVQNMPGYTQWAEQLYSRIPVEPALTDGVVRSGVKRVEIGTDGITIGGEPQPMSDADRAADIADVKAQLVPHFGSVEETERRYQSLQTFMGGLSKDEQKLITTLGERLGDDVLALRVLDAIVRKGKS